MFTVEDVCCDSLPNIQLGMSLHAFRASLRRRFFLNGPVLASSWWDSIWPQISYLVSCWYHWKNWCDDWTSDFATSVVIYQLVGQLHSELQLMNEVMKPPTFWLAIVAVVTLVLVEQVYSAHISVGVGNRRKTTDFGLAFMRVSSFYHCCCWQMGIWYDIQWLLVQPHNGCGVVLMTEQCLARLNGFTTFCPPNQPVVRCDSFDMYHMPVYNSHTAPWRLQWTWKNYPCTPRSCYFWSVEWRDE